MNKGPRTIANPAGLASLPGWRRHFTRQRLRAFVLLSIAAHLVLGMSWGLPAYVKQRRLEAEQRRQQELLEQQQKAATAALAKAKANDLAKTIQDLHDKTHKSFDNLTAELPQPDKEKTWKAVEPAVKPAEHQLAEALGDRSMTEQDLRNLQANVDRELVQAVNDTLSVDAGREEAEAFLASVEARVVPELVAHYKGEIVSKVAQPVKAAADSFVKEQGTDASAATGGADGLHAISDLLRHIADESDAAGGEVDQAQSLPTRRPPAADDEVRQHITAATSHLAAVSTAGEEAASRIAALVERAKPVTGGAEMANRLGAVVDSVTRVRDTVKTASAALAANDSANAARQLTALALAQRKLAVQWTSASEAAGQAAPRAEQLARGMLALVQDDPIPHRVDGDLADAFRDKPSDRLTGVLTEAFRKRLTAAAIKPDDALVASTEKRLKELLETKVGAADGYGASTSQHLRDAAGAFKHEKDAEGDRLAGTFTRTAEPIIKAGVADVVADTSLDVRLAEMVAKPATDGRDDVRDRVAMLAAQARDGRTTALDSVSLTDLRASAMARSSNTDQAADGAATTEPIQDSGPPVIEELKKEILASLHKELQKVFDGKLPDDKAAKVWDQVAAASDADVNHLARDLIDPNVSDSELENRRLAFSGKFLHSVGEALDKTASEDLARELLKELQGKGGDAVAGVYKNAVKENVGRALAREWREAADADGARAGQQARGVREALDSAQAVADKAVQVLDQVKGETARAAHDARDGKGDTAAVHETIEAARGKVEEIGSAIAGSKADVDKAKKDVPEEVAEIKDHLAEIGKSFDAVAGSLTDADKTAKAGDPAAVSKAVADARKEVEKFREGLSRGRADLDRQAAEAKAQFIKGAQQASDDSADKTPGVKSRVESKFNGEFRKEALPRLADQIVKDYQQKLEQAGITPDAKQADGLHSAVAAALDKKVTGDVHAGEAALEDLDRQKFFDGAKNAKSGPTTEQSDRANAIADKVADAGVAVAVHGDAAGGAAHNAVKDAAGPDAAVSELKDKVARMEGQIRGGRGGVLADNSDGLDGKDNGGLTGMRRKWQSILAGLNGDGDGNGGGKGKAGGAVASAAGGAGGAGGAAGGGRPGAGTLGGANGRGGRVDGEYDHGRYGDGYGVDKKLRDELIAVVKHRATQQGEAWGRGGADGIAAHAREQDPNRPAAILAPATQSAQSAKNDAPYTPAFKSLRFAVVPYLNKPITINDTFDAWSDIPPLHLRPQLTWSGDAKTLKILDDLPVKVAWDNHGLYFMYDVPIPEAQPAPKIRTDEFWACDCLEVFIDTMNTKEFQRGTGAGQQFWFWPFGSLDDANAPGGESFFSRQHGFNFVALKTDELQRFARHIPGGYQMQCRIPIERVRDADLTPGKIVGLNVTVETGGKIHYYWSASKLAGTSYHPDTWGDVLLGGSDGRVEFPDKLVAEAGPDALTKLLKAFVLGEPLRIRVTDHDMNLNEKVKDKLSVTVRNARGEQEVAILEETGRDTGVFEGSVRTALALGEKVPGVVSAYEGESLSVTYIDQARANGARNAEIVSEITAGPSVMLGK